MPPKKDLICTRTTGTVVHVRTLDYEMDATVKKLLKRRSELEMQRMRVSIDISTIDRALMMAGIRLSPEITRGMESEYRNKHPFRDMSLTDACLKVLRDHEGDALTKAQVEYHIAVGGYVSSAKDRRNSVGITLRRLAESGLCAVQRAKGAHGNIYSHIGGPKDVVADSRATKE